jgi:hypothetical protein
VAPGGFRSEHGHLHAVMTSPVVSRDCRRERPARVDRHGFRTVELDIRDRAGTEPLFASTARGSSTKHAESGVFGPPLRVQAFLAWLRNNLDESRSAARLRRRSRLT